MSVYNRTLWSTAQISSSLPLRLRLPTPHIDKKDSLSLSWKFKRSPSICQSPCWPRLKARIVQSRPPCRNARRRKAIASRCIVVSGHPKISPASALMRIWSTTDKTSIVMTIFSINMQNKLKSLAPLAEDILIASSKVKIPPFLLMDRQDQAKPLPCLATSKTVIAMALFQGL